MQYMIMIYMYILLSPERPGVFFRTVKMVFMLLPESPKQFPRFLRSENQLGLGGFGGVTSCHSKPFYFGGLQKKHWKTSGYTPVN